MYVAEVCCRPKNGQRKEFSLVVWNSGTEKQQSQSVLTGAKQTSGSRVGAKIPGDAIAQQYLP